MREITYANSNVSRIAYIKDEKGVIALVSFTVSHPMSKELAVVIQDAVKHMTEEAQK